ncbi:uncharacterized protein METZ01_LOCUS403781 [marine metagenome]|uniref:Uncharacterized protein n=1 Tax=marine metagenome TaxID=408172 RepID=A0A382VWP7_9ZZZZ
MFPETDFFEKKVKFYQPWTGYYEEDHLHAGSVIFVLQRLLFCR